jgi:hypothetical protein
VVAHRLTGTTEKTGSGEKRLISPRRHATPGSEGLTSANQGFTFLLRKGRSTCHLCRIANDFDWPAVCLFYSGLCGSGRFSVPNFEARLHLNDVQQPRTFSKNATTAPIPSKATVFGSGTSVTESIEFAANRSYGPG